MKITLLYPPHWAPYQPYPSLPYLTGFLKSRSYNVTQRDVNIELADYITSASGLKRAYKRIEERLKKLNKNEEEFKQLSRWENIHAELIRSIRGAKNLLKDPKSFFNYRTFKNSSVIFAKAYEMVSDSYYPTYMDFYYLGQKYSNSSTEDIVKAVNDREGNLYIDYFEEFTIPSLKKEPSDFYGISITDNSQTIPGITLAGMLKNAFPDAHICIGGNIFTKVGFKLVPSSPLFDFFDSIIIYEGEFALAELLKALENGQDFSEVPNIIYKNKKGRVIFNEKIINADVNDIPPPDFDGFPLDKYISPFPILPILTARGCYWNKCTFCQHKYNYFGGYRQRKVEYVVDDIESLYKKYGCKYFSFNDEAILPIRLKEIAEEIIKRNLDIRWEAHGRAEKKFDKDLSELLFKSGCRMLSFGLESSSPRVLKLMCKGIDINILKNLLSHTSNAGIWNHLWFFTGFPSETEEEAISTVDFIIENQDRIHSVPFNVSFGLEDDTDIIKNPDKYSIKEIKPIKKNDLSFIFDYTVTGGLSQEKAEKLAKDFQERLLKEHRQGIIIYTMTGVHRMLYVDHFLTNDLAGRIL